MFSNLHTLYDDTLPSSTFQVLTNKVHVPSVGLHDLFCKFTQKIRGFHPRAMDNVLNKS